MCSRKLKETCSDSAALVYAGFIRVIKGSPKSTASTLSESHGIRFLSVLIQSVNFYVFFFASLHRWYR